MKDLMSCMTVLLVLYSGPALAWDGTAGADTVWFGCVDKPGDGHTGKQGYLCVNSSWQLVDNDCTLDNGFDFNGLGGADAIRGVLYSSTSITCGGYTLNWDPLAHNQVLISVYGGAGDDYLVTDFGWTRLYGGDDDDTLFSYNASLEDGGAGWDRVEALSGGDDDDLYGGSGDDCLNDHTGTWAVFDCGSGWDYYVDSGVDPYPDNCNEQAYNNTCQGY